MGEGKTRGHFLFGINQWADQTAGFPTFQAPNSIVQDRCMYILYVYPGFNIYIYKYSIIRLDIYISGPIFHMSHPPWRPTRQPACPPARLTTPTPAGSPSATAPSSPRQPPQPRPPGPPQTTAAPFLPCQCSPLALAYRRNPLPAAAPFQPQLPLQRPPAFSPPPAASPTCRVSRS